MSKVPIRNVARPSSAPSDTQIDVSVGGTFREEWTEKVQDLARVGNGIHRMRGAVKQVASAVRKIDELPPEQRALNLERLAKAGEAAIKTIEDAAKAEAVHGEIMAAYGRTVREQLCTVIGEMQSQLAASQVRDYLRGLNKRDRADALTAALNDLESVRAILGAPPMASGLTSDEYARFEFEATRRYLPDIHEGRQIVNRSREVFAAAKKNAIKMVADTAGLKQKAPGGQWVPVWQIDA